MKADKLKIGLYVKANTKMPHKEHPEWYPKPGTIGIIKVIYANSADVKWQYGSTSDNDCWLSNCDWFNVYRGITDEEKRTL